MVEVLNKLINNEGRKPVSMLELENKGAVLSIRFQPTS